MKLHKLDPMLLMLLDELEQAPQHLHVLVELMRPPTAAQIAWLEHAGVRVAPKQTLLTGNIASEDLSALSEQPNIKRVYLSQKIYPLTA